MPLPVTLGKLEHATIAEDPTSYATLAVELINIMSQSQPRLELTETETEIAANVTDDLLQCPAQHFAGLGFALLCATQYFSTGVGRQFFTATESRGHGAWAIVRALDNSYARKYLPHDGSSGGHTNHNKMFTAYLCLCDLIIDAVNSGKLDAAAIAPCIVDRLLWITMHPETDSSLGPDCVAALRKFIVLCPEQSSACGALGALVRSYVDGSALITPAELLATINSTVNRHGMRHVSELDLSPLFFAYADVFSAPDSRLYRARSVLSRLPETWSGLFVLASTVGIKELVRLIQLPGATVRRILLIELFHSFIRNCAPHRCSSADGPWQPTLQKVSQNAGVSSPRARAQTAAVADAFDLVDDEDEFRNSSDPDAAFDDGAPMFMAAGEAGSLAAAPPELVHHTRDAIIASLLTLLNSVDLNEALMSVIQSTSGYDTALPESAALVLQEILVLEHSYLPDSVVELVHMKLDRVVASAALANDPFIGALTTKLFHLVTYQANQIDQVMSSTGASVSYAAPQQPASVVQLKALIRTTQVLESSVTEVDKWNFGLIIDLCRIHLRNNANLIAAKELRFFEKLLNFYKPTTADNKVTPFRALPRRTTVASCGLASLALLELLLSTPDGVLLLMEHQVAQKLTKFFKDAVMSGKGGGNAELVTSMASEYLRWLYILTRSRVGIQLLHDAGFFENMSEAFTDKNSNKECKKLIVNSVYFGTVHGHGVDERAKLFLNFVVASGDALLRLTAVARLERYVRADLWSQADWVVEILLSVVQLSGNDTVSSGSGVVTRALSLLRFICAASPIGLRAVALRCEDLLRIFVWNSAITPSLLDIFYLLLRVENVAQALVARGWVTAALEHWATAAPGPAKASPRWVKYAEHYDASFAGTLGKDSDTDTDGDSDPDSMGAATMSNTDEFEQLIGVEQPHFFGALGATMAGCKVLESSELFGVIVAMLSTPVSPRATGGNVTAIRAALHAVGQVASNDLAHLTTITDEMLTSIHALTSSCQLPQLRGAAIAALSMVARCHAGRERLEQLLGLGSCSRTPAYSTAHHAVCAAYAFDPTEPAKCLVLTTAVTADADHDHAAEARHGRRIGKEDCSTFPLNALTAGVNCALNAKKSTSWSRLIDLRTQKPKTFFNSQSAVTWFNASERLTETERSFISLLFNPSVTAEALEAATKKLMMKR